MCDMGISPPDHGNMIEYMLPPKENIPIFFQINERVLHLQYALGKLGLAAEEAAIVFKPFVGVALTGHIFALLGCGFRGGKLLGFFVQSDFQSLFSAAADVAKVNVNLELAEQYAAALNQLAGICAEQNYQPKPEVLAKFPDVLTVTKADEDLETVSEDLCAVLDQALAAYNAMRAVEGSKLAEDISGRLTNIENYTTQVEARSPETVAEYRAKLTARMQEVLQSTTIDPQRILTEAAIYADKVAVDEETVRLRSHVAQLRTMLESDEPMGRKMDFLIQEVNRESNTIGSKCNDVSIAQVVIGLKAEVEKMREQVQNVE